MYEFMCMIVYQILHSLVIVCIFEISLNKYGCQIANMNHTAIMLHEHTDSEFLHMCAKRQETPKSASHIIAMYVPAANIPLMKLSVPAGQVLPDLCHQ